MDYFLVLALLSIIIYGCLILSFFRGWEQIKPIRAQTLIRKKTLISVIIPFRDEAPNLKTIITGLASQQFSGQFEVIMVDDGSEDEGPELIKKLKEQYPWLKMVKSDGVGKKAAIKKGIQHAKGELIITTDADCKVETKWLQTIYEFYLLNRPDMIVMPVKLSEGNSILYKFQQLDYLAMQIVTAGAIGIRKPIICSGANLAFKKEAFIKTAPEMAGQDYLSGDDVFLLHAFKKHNYKIYYLKSQQVIVEAQPAPTTKTFLEQRIRWGGKSKEYKDSFALFTAIIVLISNFSLALIPVTAIWYKSHFFYGIGIWTIKILLDGLLLSTGNKFFSIKNLFRNLILFSFIYPYYIVTAALAAIFFKEKWKRRKGK